MGTQPTEADPPEPLIVAPTDTDPPDPQTVPRAPGEDPSSAAPQQGESDHDFIPDPQSELELPKELNQFP